MTHLSSMVECDHLRPLVWFEDKWHHLLPEGLIGGPCGATSAYRVRVEVLDQHAVSKWQKPPTEPTT